MIKGFLQNNVLGENLPHNRKNYTIALSAILCLLLISSCRLISCTHDSQKDSILENTLQYSTLLDEYISYSNPDLTEGLSMPREAPAMPSTAAFAVLRNGHILLIEGHDVLSYKLVSSISEIARSTSSLYKYDDGSLPDYYFYTVSSQVSGLDYCYYEPVLTGWPFIQKMISTNWLWFLFNALLFFAAILTISLMLATSPAAAAEANRIVDITVPADNTQEASFGSFPYFSGIIIEYHSTSLNSANPEIIKVFDQIIQENLAFNKISYQIACQRNSDCLQYYMNFNNYNLRVLCDSLKMNLFNAAPDYEINIYYSAAVPTCEEMENELFYLHQHLNYSLILGYNMRLSIEQVRKHEASAAVLDTNVAGTIQNHLRTRAYDDLYSYLNHYKNVLKHHRHTERIWYSFSEVYRFAEEAFSAVKLFFQENSFEHPMVQTTCITILRSNPGFSAFCEYLTACIQSYQQANQHVLSSRNEQIMNSIYMYIEQDLAGANLNSIARKMQMTDSHLSRVFKKNTGSNFSEYLSERKLEEAAKLLKQDSKLKVADISDMLGYGNPTYFLSRFKAKYGVSPSAYRKEYIADNAAKQQQNP